MSLLLTLKTNFTHCSDVSIVGFEQENAGLACCEIADFIKYIVTKISRWTLKVNNIKDGQDTKTISKICSKVKIKISEIINIFAVFLLFNCKTKCLADDNVCRRA